MTGNKRILVIDDEKDCCDFFKNYFTRHGHFVDVAYDGDRAKDLIEEQNYDIIFVDCNLPGLSGVELVKIIKENNPKAYMVMISGYDLIKEDFAKSLGVDEFLNKPISISDIEKIVEQVK